MDTYTSYGVVLKPTGELTAATIGGITNQNLINGAQHSAEPTAGQTRPSQSEITSINPRGTIGTYDIPTLLQLIGSEGACLSGGATEGFALYQLLLEKCGSISADPVHRKLIIPNGRIVPRNLSVGHRQNAQLTAEVLAIFDGTNDPVIVTTSAAAPTGLTDTFRYTLGPVSVGGIDVEGNTSIDLNFGIEIQGDSGDSDVFDSQLQVLTVKPELSITTRDVSKFGGAGIPLKGLHGTHANSSLVLRRRKNGTGEFSSAADHIKITFDGMISVDQAHAAQANQRGEMTIKVTALDDGTNDPLVFDYAHLLA